MHNTPKLDCQAIAFRVVCCFLCAWLLRARRTLSEEVGALYLRVVVAAAVVS